jgi:uncharacterized protein (DUF58 family)
VQLRRCTQGLCLVAALIICCAYVLDDMVVLLAGCTLIGGIVGQYLLFDRQFRETVASVTIQRSPERTQVRKGTTLRMTTSITLRVPPRIQVELTERLPHGAALQDGTTSITAISDPMPRDYHLSYRITPLIHGTLHFPGISMVVRNLFFITQIELSAESFSGPALLVQPVGIFESSMRRSTIESREIEKMSVVSGFGIRALREYYAGDDIRAIDWKHSAKYDKLYVREYTGVINLPPLIVVDLPWSGAAVPEPDFNRLVAAVAGMAEYSVRTFQYVSILLVSGPNILQYMGEEKDIQRCMSDLREWMHPAERTVHLYHLLDRADLRGQIRRLEDHLSQEENDRARAFCINLRKYTLTALQHQRNPAFYGQLARTISPLTLDDLFLFSLGSGDTSHIRMVIRQARSMKIKVHLRVPDISSGSYGTSSWSRLGPDTLEVFA